MQAIAQAGRQAGRGLGWDVSLTTDPDAYVARGCGRCARFDTADCSARLHAPALEALRRLCRASGLAETARWGHPCYTHAGRNVALIGAQRDGARLSLFDAALLDDPAGLMAPAGPNSRSADTIRFADAGDVAARAAALAGLLAQAKAHAAAGRRAPRPRAEAPALPDDLVAALAADPALARAFAALTPGRQRSFALALSAAKAPATRAARIARFRAAILAGKGADGR